MSQGDLFGAEADAGGKPVKAYVPDPKLILARLEEMSAEMKAARTWPWEPPRTKMYGEFVLPYLCNKLTDPVEAQTWRDLIAAESARLDASA